jgi:DNA topoisomerase-3
MTERMVRKAKEYDRDTIPGDYATLANPCPNCGGVVKENYRRYACIGSANPPEASGGTSAGDSAAGSAQDAGCGFSFTKTPAGRAFELPEVEAFLRDKKVGPLEGFRSKAGWPFTAEIALKFSEEDRNWKLEFDFGDPLADAESGEIMDFSASADLGPCPKCAAAVHELGKNYVCQKSVPTAEQATPSCDFKSGKVILQQTVEPEQISKLLATGKTDLLDKFVSMRTRRPFKAFLAWDKDAGKVSFEFEPSKYPARKTAGTEALTAASKAVAQAVGKTAAKTTAKKVGKTAAKTAAKPAAKKAASKAPRKTSTAVGKQPSAALAGVIGSAPVSRPEAIKKMWEYIKAKGLQDAANKRAINADSALLEVFGKPQINMFELAGLLGKHLA